MKNFVDCSSVGHYGRLPDSEIVFGNHEIGLQITNFTDHFRNSNGGLVDLLQVGSKPSCRPPRSRRQDL